MKLFNGSHKSSITWQNSAAPPSDNEMFTQRTSGFSDSRFLCSHLVENEDVITLREITLLKHKSWIEQRIRYRQKFRYFMDICFLFCGRTQSNSKRGEIEINNCGKVTLEGEVGGFVPVSGRNVDKCDNKFLGRCNSLSLYNFQRETRLQRRSSSGSWKYRDLLQQNNPMGRQRIDSYLGPTVEFNPIPTQNVVQNVTQYGIVVCGVPSPGANRRAILRNTCIYARL